METEINRNVNNPEISVHLLFCFWRIFKHIASGLFYNKRKHEKSNVTAAFNNISTYRLVLHYSRREQGEKTPL